MTDGKNNLGSPQRAMYTPAGFYMLRTPALPAQTFLTMTNMERNAQEDEKEDFSTQLKRKSQYSYDILKALVLDPVIKQALLVASPDIHESIVKILHEDKTSQRTAHVYSGILRYLIRMSTRPTPFGLFSGVAVGYLGENTTLEISTPAIQHIRTRPDMGWLLSIVQKIEEETSLIPNLHVMLNRTVYIAGARAILPYADIYGNSDKRSIALRATPVVQFTIERARNALPYKQLQQQLLEAFPRSTQKQIDGFLQQLWENHFLISDLRPPLTSANPAKYILERLQRIEEAEEVVTGLRKVLAATERIDLEGVGGSTQLIYDLVHVQQEVAPDKKNKKELYQIDAALGLEHPNLNISVGEVVADAVETLLRLSRFTRGTLHLREYHSAFVERYGTEAEVPLLDLLSAEVGLDAPPDYTEPPRAYPLPALPPTNMEVREGVLSSLVAEALNQHAIEIELTETMVQNLSLGKPDADNPPPPAIEMYLQIHATSREAVDRGEWRGVIGSASLTYGGRTFYRFFDILEPEAMAKLQAYVKSEEMLSPDVIFAELSYLPTIGRQANVAVRPALRAYEIVVNTEPSVPEENVLVLSDLLVGVRGGHFYLRSQRLKKKVVVVQSHMLTMMHAPNVCRFLLDVSMDSYIGPSSFDWGIVGNAPFLPRIVRKQMVLSLAQWNLRPEMIEPSGRGSAEAQWFAGLQKWRERWHVPRYVYLAQLDNRLLLDLEHPLFVAELFAELPKIDAHRSLRLQEMLPDFDHLWLRDSRNEAYISELVVPLILKKREAVSPSATEIAEMRRKEVVTPQYPQGVITDVQRRKLPGDEWIYLKLYTTYKQFDEIIAGPLREVVQQLDKKNLIDRWFYIRYADPEPHLRVRLHALDFEAVPTVLLEALTWSRMLVQRGLIGRVCVDSYDREIERYGGPKAIDVLEQVFTSNSAIVSEIIAAQYAKQITLDPLAVAVFTLDQLFASWGFASAQRLQYSQARTEKYANSDAFRPHRRLFCELLSPWDPTYDVTLQEQREKLYALSSSHDHIIASAATYIHELAMSGALWQTEEYILGSLAHMHINRLLGFKREQEQKIYTFWRHTLESLQRRPARKD